MTDSQSTVTDAPLNTELRQYELQVGAVSVSVILHDWAEGIALYRVAGETQSVADAADHDGPVIRSGCFRRYLWERQTVIGSHPHAGNMEYRHPEESFDAPVVLLDRLNEADTEVSQ